MGSSGPGRISDYPGSSSPSKPQETGNGDSTPEDRCARAFNVRLEDIEQSDYYQARGTIPPIGAQLEVVHRKRLVAQMPGGVAIGNLPTSFNYLAGCIKDGWNYVGTIQSAAIGPPVATISADFVAMHP